MENGIGWGHVGWGAYIILNNQKWWFCIVDETYSLEHFSDAECGYRVCCDNEEEIREEISNAGLTGVLTIATYEW